MKLQNLPNELLFIIFQFVVEAPKDILKICGICRRFYKLTMHNEHNNNRSNKFRRKEKEDFDARDEVLSYCIGSGAQTPRKLKYNNLLEHKRIVHDEDISIEKVLWGNVRRWSMEKYFEQVNKHSNIYSSIDPFRARAIDFSNNLAHKLPLSIVFRKYFEPTYSQSIFHNLNIKYPEPSSISEVERRRITEPNTNTASTSSSPFATCKVQHDESDEGEAERIRTTVAALGLEDDLNLALDPNVHCIKDLQKHDDIPLEKSRNSPFQNFADYRNSIDSLIMEEGVVSGVLQKFHLAKIRRSDLLNYSLLNTTVNVLLFLYVCILWSLGLADLRLIRWNMHATFLGFLFPLTNEFSVLYFAFIKNYYMKKSQTELKSHTQSLISITILFFAIWSWVSMLLLKILDLIVPVEETPTIPSTTVTSAVQTIGTTTAALAKVITESYFSTANHQCKSVIFPMLPSALATAQEKAANSFMPSNLCDHWFVLTFPIIGLLMVCSLIEWQRIGMLEVQNNGIIIIRLPNPNIELDDLAIGGFMIPTLAITLACFSLSMDRIMSSLTDGLLLACLLVLILEQAVVVFASLRKKRYLSGIVIGVVIWIEFNMIFGIGVSLLTMLPFLLLVVIAHALFLYSCKLGIIRRIANLFVGI